MTAAGSRWGVALVAALLAGCVAPAPAPAPAEARPYVVMISFDAFRHDYIDRYHPPVLEGLAARGLRAQALIPSFPTKTFPNHYTLATGLHPGHHGIVGNTFFDPVRDRWYRLGDTLAVRDSSWYGGEPIWVTAERNGVRAGVFSWPGSEAAIGGMRPSYSTQYFKSTPNEQRVDGVIGWLRREPAARPHLVMLYVSDIDDTTHRRGPDAPSTARAVALVDRVLGRLMDSLAALPIRDSVNVVVVSDHGMAAVSAERVVPVFDALVRAGVDTTGVKVSDNGPTMSLWFGSDTARRARARLALARELHRADVYDRAEIPERFHAGRDPRIGDLLLVAWPGHILLRRGTDTPPSGGAHGYDPAWEEMHGIFVAAGPNVRRAGVIAPFENVHVYPFIAALLRLERVPATDGDAAVLGRYVTP